MAQVSNGSSGGGGGGDGGGGGGSNGFGANGSCSRSSKKMKQKKVPQRGLGVAQLERIRIEEQQKKDHSLQQQQQQQHVSPMFPSSNPLVSPSIPQSFNLQSVPNFRLNPSPSSIIPLPPPPAPVPNPLFRNPSSFPNKDFPNPNSATKPPNGIGMGLEWPLRSATGQANWPHFRNGDNNNHEGGGGGPKPSPDQLGGFRGNMNGNLPYECSNPIWNSPSLLQRTQQFQQQQPYSSSMVNVSSGTSSSSGISFNQMEPPSNQSYYGRNFMGSEEDKSVLVGGKRPYPFSLSDAPGPTLPSKIPRPFVPPFSRSDESTSCGNGEPVRVEPIIPIFREGGWRSSSTPDMSSKGGNVEENGNLNRDFLSLAPPATGSPGSRSNHKQSWNHSTPHNLGISEIQDFAHQVTIQFPILHPLGSNGSDRNQQPLQSLFPPARARMDEASTSGTSRNGEGDQEELDLKLKL